MLRELPELVSPGESRDFLPSETEIRRQIDPDSTLPDTVVRIYDATAYRNGSLILEEALILHGGVAAGFCTLNTNLDSGVTNFASINLNTTDYFDKDVLYDLPKRERPKGLGLATYLIAIELAHRRGLAFESGPATLTRGSNRIWQILTENAVATVIDPPEFDVDDKGHEIVYAAYRSDIPG
jgi:hypothetical protein